MKQKTNIVELLKDAPKGTKLYSPIDGMYLLLKDIKEASNFPIIMQREGNFSNNIRLFSKYGTCKLNPNAEVMLFPSKDCRSWKDFKAPWLHKHFEAGEKVLVVYGSQVSNCEVKRKWRLNIYSHFDEDEALHYCVNSAIYEEREIIPYRGNEDKLGKEANNE